LAPEQKLHISVVEVPNPQYPSLDAPETHESLLFVASVFQSVQSVKSLLSWNSLVPLVESGPGQKAVLLTMATSDAEYCKQVCWQTIFCEVAAEVPL
jgi:hypothetical protein